MKICITQIIFSIIMLVIYQPTVAGESEEEQNARFAECVADLNSNETVATTNENDTLERHAFGCMTACMYLALHNMAANSGIFLFNNGEPPIMVEAYNNCVDKVGSTDLCDIWACISENLGGPPTQAALLGFINML